ncbi:MAG: ABC transporter ATP-binding protein/permease [Maledivibacter sp.]|jgi:ATP-binding cassette subfamily B protein|nr:ABC transporter ATP-binding protein/permease [Maledivibacter sp.]
MKKIKLLFKFMKGNRLLYFGAVLAIGFATCFEILIPLVLRVTIDSIIGDKPMEVPVWIANLIQANGGKSVLLQNLWLCGAILVILTVINGAFLYLKGKWSAVASESVAKNIREKLYDHLQHLPFDYHVKAQTGDLIQRCTSDVETIRKFLSIQFVEIGRVLFILVFSIGVMVSLNRTMTLVAVSLIPLVFIFTLVFFFKVQKAFKLSDESEARLSTVLQENLSGVRVVRAFARQEYEVDKFDERNTEYRDVTYKLIKMLAWFWSCSDLLCFLQIGAVLVFGAYFASIGVMTLGTLYVFISYERKLIFPIRQMGRILTDLGKSLVSIERINEILDAELEDGLDEGKKPQIKGEIEFKDVCFQYDGDRTILKNISFNVKPGETVAILGSTGSGKTSLVNLLLRLYDYNEGNIRIDGIELRDINKKWLREQIGIVLQEPFLYSKTLKENIGVTKKDIKESEISEASKIASIHDVILDFEKGYETSVGERGVTLSGGQKQRVAIARTIIRNSNVLIFDDSLSAVDTETDLAIRRALKEKRKDVTTFIISHRINTLSEADLILIVEDGEIVQSGKHEDLINKEGLYKRIWALQNSLEEELDKEIKTSSDDKLEEAAS